MKASVLTNYGSPDFFKLTEVENPTPGDDEVLVKVVGASVNSWDWEIMMGKPFVNRMMFGIFKPAMPILGADMAGRVEAVGKNIQQFKPGDEVYGDMSGCGWGGFAEYVCAPEHALVLKPASLTFEQAAAVPQAALLALQAVRDKGQVQPGQKVLINGAGGGAGTFALQMAKYFGAEVTGVDSTEKLDIMRSNGADHVIDYTQHDFTRNGLRYDQIVDMATTHSIFDCIRALSPRGTYVVVGGPTAGIFQVMLLGSWMARIENKKMGLLLHKANKGLADLKALFETGKVVPVIDRCYPLSAVADAIRYFDEGHAKGKIVITVEHAAIHERSIRLRHLL